MTNETSDVQTDPYLWLEDVAGDRSMAWVDQHNALTRKALEIQPEFGALSDRFEAALTAPDALPFAVRRGAWFYNFWQDQAHPRGLFRRTTLASYRSADTQWEVVVDLDLLAAEEGENWVWSSAEWLRTDHSRLLIGLSRGGGDAKVIREFDVIAKRFVEGGFALAEAKHEVAWMDRDTLFVGSDFGPDSYTKSGYARIVKVRRRGEDIDKAETIFEASADDMVAAASRELTPGFERSTITVMPDFFSNHVYLWQDGAATRIDKPDDADITLWRDWAIFRLRSAWTTGGETWPAGAAIIADLNAFLAGTAHFQMLFTPNPRCNLAGISFTASQILLSVEENVASRVEIWSHDGSVWSGRPMAAPAHGNINIIPLHDPHQPGDPHAEDVLLIFSGFLTPNSFSLVNVNTGHAELLKTSPANFDSKGMRVEQRFATSKDGTQIPYFIIFPKTKPADGLYPTLLHAYGGLNVSLTPGYLGTRGIGWLERGGVFVQANIRGGGEFGPGWHQAALQGKRQVAFDDFIAVAEDLIASGVTSPQHLGIEGGSNGGLLVSSVMVQRPDLFNAVICQVPLTDMQRYHLMLAGASWMAEFGDPDNPDDWAYLSRYSPYHNVRAGTRYPKILFTTSTRDDRVHPAHARKMAARMIEQGHDVLYYENTEGGHAGAANSKQRADKFALEAMFLTQQLMTS